MIAFNNTSVSTFMQDTQPGMGRKRKRHRETASCEACRQKKVRCDRESPCNQCSKQDSRDDCTYSNSKGHAERSSMPAPKRSLLNSPTPARSSSEEGPSKSAREEIQALKNRLERLEQRTANLPEQCISGLKPRSQRHTGVLQGEARLGKTRYMGNTHWAALIQELPEVRTMLSKHPEFNTSRQNLSRLKQNYLNRSVSMPQHLVSGEVPMGANHLLPLLPEREDCDRLTDLYFDTFGGIYDFIHKRSFQLKYQALWGSHEPSPPVLISLILLVIALGMHNDVAQKMRARNIVHAVETYMSLAGNIRKPCIAVFQCLCLIIVSKYIDCSETDSPDGLWSSLGVTMRVALATGLHRDPACFDNITPFRAELRKRLWANFLRMDLEFAVQYGMPHLLRDSDHDTPLPSNYNEDEIDEAMTTLPPSHSDDVYTTSSFGITMAKLARIGGQIQQDVCSATKKPAQEMETHKRRLQEVLQSVPKKLRNSLGVSGPISPPILRLQRAMISVYVTRSELILDLEMCRGLTSGTYPDKILERALFVVTTVEDVERTPFCWRVAQTVLLLDMSRAIFIICLLVRQLYRLESSPGNLMNQFQALKSECLDAPFNFTELLHNDLDVGFKRVKLYVLFHVLSIVTEKLSEDPTADLMPCAVEAASAAARFAAEHPQYRLGQYSTSHSPSNEAPQDSVATPATVDSDSHEAKWPPAIDDLPRLDEMDMAWFDDIPDEYVWSSLLHESYGDLGKTS